MTANILKKMRKTLGLSQKEMAGKIYVSFPTYNGYENGKNIPRNKHDLINVLLKKAQEKEIETIKSMIEKSDIKDLLIDIIIELKDSKQ